MLPILSLLIVSAPGAILQMPDAITAISLAGDGGFSVATAKGEVSIYDREQRLQAQFRERGPVFALAFSPDGARLATGIRDDGRNVTTAIWTRAGKLVRYFDALAKKPPAEKDLMSYFEFKTTSALAWSPDGKLLAVEHGGHMDTGVRIWNTEGKIVADLGNQQVRSGERAPMAAGVKAVRFAPDGRSIVTSMDDGYVRLWDLEGRVKWQTKVSEKDVAVDADFSTDGSEIVFATSFEDRFVGGLAADSGMVRWTQRVPDYPMVARSLAKEKVLYVNGKSLSVAAPGSLRTLRTLPAVVTSLALSANRRTALVATDKHQVLFVDVAE